MRRSCSTRPRGSVELLPCVEQSASNNLKLQTLRNVRHSRVMSKLEVCPACSCDNFIVSFVNLTRIVPLLLLGSSRYSLPTTFFHEFRFLDAFAFNSQPEMVTPWAGHANRTWQLCAGHVYDHCVFLGATYSTRYNTPSWQDDLLNEE